MRSVIDMSEEFGENFTIKMEDYRDNNGDENILFEEELLESFKKLSSNNDKIIDIFKGAKKSEIIGELERKKSIMFDISFELKNAGLKNPIIHNFVCDKNLKNHNIKVGLFFYSSHQNSLSTMTDIISNIILGSIEFENLTLVDNSMLNPKQWNYIKNNHSLMLTSSTKNPINNIELIMFAYCNTNLFNIESIETLVIKEMFAINENYINANIL